MKALSLQERLSSLKSAVSDSFDVVYRNVEINHHRCVIVFLSSLSDSQLIADIVESIVITVKSEVALTFYPGSVEAKTNQHQAITALLSGQCLVLVEGIDAYFCVETRSYPSRSTAEPSVEKSIRGSHDGFVENIILNVGLIRRRIRDPHLRIVINKEGVKTRTDIAYVYIEHLVDPDILADFEHRLKTLDETEILSERNLSEQLYGKTWNPYPHVRYSERPDICAIHLLQGYLIVLVDNSPCAIIIPTTFFEQTKQIEEYTQTTLIATFTRIIRLVGILFSIYLLPLWITVIIDKNPTMLNFPLEDHVKVLEFGFQVIFADIVVEWIRQSLIHTPTILSGIMSFIVIFVLGDTAVNFGVYTNEILLMIALCNIGNFLTPNYELSLANKAFRILIGLMALFFGQAGFCIGVLFHVIVLLSTKSIKFPYLYPFIPFSYRECKKILFGAPIRLKKDD
ncbi:spore germination protein [bacterium c-19]|nr:spore germination protein [bacterium c-19]